MIILNEGMRGSIVNDHSSLDLILKSLDAFDWLQNPRKDPFTYRHIYELWM